MGKEIKREKCRTRLGWQLHLRDAITAQLLLYLQMRGWEKKWPKSIKKLTIPALLLCLIAYSPHLAHTAEFLSGLQNLGTSLTTFTETSVALLTLGTAGEDIHLGLVMPASVRLAWVLWKTGWTAKVSNSSSIRGQVEEMVFDIIRRFHIPPLCASSKQCEYFVLQFSKAQIQQDLLKSKV